MSTAVFGAPEWRAQSGRSIKVGQDGTMNFHLGNGYLSPNTAMDAEEFFQAKRDAELGRVRDPLDPHYVIYDVADDRVYVIDERTGQKAIALREDVGTFEPRGRLRGHFKAAWAYFEAHPVRRPWHDAKYGEVWEVAHTGDQVDLCRVNGWERFDQVSGTGLLVSMPITHDSIIAARKVWPEDAS